MDPPSQKHRQAGQSSPGRLIKGNMIDAYRRTSQPSIPSKYEFLLVPNTRIKKGFGAKSPRFLRSLEPSPGPAEYNKPSESHELSMSKRGYGSLINRTNRFNRYQYSTLPPGPGCYDPKQTQKSPSYKITEHKSKALTAKLEKFTTPAPGDYDPKYQSSPASVSPFKSRTYRANLGLIADTPAPNMYSPNYDVIKGRKGTVKLKPRLNLRKEKYNLYDPFGVGEAEMTPGPGEYEVGVKKNRSKPDPMFVMGEVDRFGNQLNPKVLVQETPGPGQYTNDIIEHIPKITASDSAFISETQRQSMQPKRNPGPAYYQPKSPERKSFHYNLSQLWV